MHAYLLPSEITDLTLGDKVSLSLSLVGLLFSLSVLVSVSFFSHVCLPLRSLSLSQSLILWLSGRVSAQLSLRLVFV